MLNYHYVKIKKHRVTPVLDFRKGYDAKIELVYLYIYIRNLVAKLFMVTW